MEISNKEYERIAAYLPVQRGNVEVENVVFLNALLYAIENGCKWRKMPEKYGKWDTIYQRARRWSHGASVHGVAERANHQTCVACQHDDKGTPGRSRGREKNGKQCIGKTAGGWNTKLHVCAIDDRLPIDFSLTSGEAADRKLLLEMGPVSTHIYLNRDKAYEDNETRELAALLGYTPVVPPKSNRVEPWEYDGRVQKPQLG